MRRGRRSLRDTVAAAALANAYYAGMAGKPPPEATYANLPPRKTRKRRSASGKPLERHILKAVLDALRHHPKVAFAWRLQSGTFMDGDRYIRVGSRGLPDIAFMLKGGTMGCIECKSETGRVTSEQLEVLGMIKRHGGIAGVCRSVEDALALIA